MRTKAIIACILWGSAFAGAKIGFQYADPIFLSGIRFILAGLMLVPVMWVMKVDFKHALKHWRFMLLFAFVQTFLQYGLFFMGLHKVPGAVSSIIIGAGPLFVAIMAHLTLKDDKMSVRKMLAILIGLSGIVFISLAKGGFEKASSTFYTGVGLLLLSNLIGSFTNIMVVKKKSAKISPIALTAFANFTGGIMLLITSFLYEKPQNFNFPLEFYGAVLWLATISAVGFSIWYTLLNRPGVKVSELNIWKFIIPVAGAVLSWLFVKGESPDMPTVIGIVIITFALLLMQAPKGFYSETRKRILKM